jgi:putative hemolysin
MDILFIEIGVVVLCILLNGFFALSEMALVSANRLRLLARAKAGSRGAAKALALLERPEAFFPTVQVGITLVGVFTGAYGGATLADVLAASFADVPALAGYAASLSLGLVVAGITYLSIVVGELVPKRLAFAHPERLAVACAPVMSWLMAVAAPVVRLLGGSTELLLRLFRVAEARDRHMTEEDLRGLLSEAARTGVLEQGERRMVERIMRLGDRRVGLCMTHRLKVSWLDAGAPAEENLRTVMDNPFSRYPVARGDLSAVIGVVRAKEYLAALARGETPDLAGLAHDPVYVLESTRVLTLLERFRRRAGMRFAVVVDEYGDVQGIVTLGDILEAVVGDIPAPDEVSEPAAVRREDGSWLLDGILPVDEVHDILGLGNPDPAEAHRTLAGFVLARLPGPPAMGEAVIHAGWRFEIVDMDGRRIDRVLAAPDAAPAAS